MADGLMTGFAQWARSGSKDEPDFRKVERLKNAFRSAGNYSCFADPDRMSSEERALHVERCRMNREESRLREARRESDPKFDLECEQAEEYDLNREPFNRALDVLREQVRALGGEPVL